MTSSPLLAFWALLVPYLRPPLGDALVERRRQPDGLLVAETVPVLQVAQERHAANEPQQGRAVLAGVERRGRGPSPAEKDRQAAKPRSDGSHKQPRPLAHRTPNSWKSAFARTNRRLYCDSVTPSHPSTSTHNATEIEGQPFLPFCRAAKRQGRTRILNG